MLLNVHVQQLVLLAKEPVELSRPAVCSHPSGEYSRLNTAPWVWVLKLTDSTAGFIEQYKLVIVRKLSRAGSTNTPRLINLLLSHENRLFPRRPSVPETPTLAACVSALSLQSAGCSPAVVTATTDGELGLGSIRPLLPLAGKDEPTGTMSSSTSESSMPCSSSLSEMPPQSGLPCDSSASSLSLWCPELIVVFFSGQAAAFFGAQV